MSENSQEIGRKKARKSRREPITFVTTVKITVIDDPVMVANWWGAIRDIIRMSYEYGKTHPLVEDAQ